MFSQEKTRYIFLFNDFHRNSSRMQLKLISSEHEKSGSHRFQKSMKQSFHKKKLKLKVEVKERVHAIWSYKERSYKEPGLRF